MSLHTALKRDPDLDQDIVTIVDFGQPRPGPRRPAIPDVFETLAISAVPPFQRAAALPSVKGTRSVQSAPTRATLTPSHSTRPIRLTRRGRLVLLVTAIMLMLFGFSIGKSVSLASTAPTPAVQTGPAAQTEVVQPGETLWAIASRVAPNTDPRVTIQRIIALNGLRSTNVLAGQRLVLPS